MAQAYLGLGSNLGDRRENLRRALAGAGAVGTVEALSTVYETEPVGHTDQPPFWNMVARLRTEVPPRPLLAALKEVERAVGREPTFPGGPRIIDIDLLLYDDEQVDDGLQVPHPRMMQRAFVLRPLLELDPELVHPVSGVRVADALAGGSFEAVLPLFPGSALFQAEEES